MAEPIDPARIMASRLGLPVREFPIEVTALRARPPWPPLVSAAVIALDRPTLIRLSRPQWSVLRNPPDGGDYIPVTYVGVDLLSLQ